MNKRITFLIFISFLVGTAFAQNIDESIPKFGERAFELNRNLAIDFLQKRHFVIYDRNELIASGVNEDDVINEIGGVGHLGIVCEILFKNGSNIVKEVSIGTIVYRNVKYLVKEFEDMGYILKEKNRKNNSSFEYIFGKFKGNYFYLCQVGIHFNSNGCESIVKMYRSKKK